MKSMLLALITLGSISAFAVETQVTVESSGRSGDLEVSGTYSIRRGCMSGTLVAATEAVEADMATLSKGDRIEVSASKISNECIFLTRKIRKL